MSGDDVMRHNYTIPVYFPCQICEKRFNSKAELKSHVSDVHPHMLIEGAPMPGVEFEIDDPDWYRLTVDETWHSIILRAGWKHIEYGTGNWIFSHTEYEVTPQTARALAAHLISLADKLEGSAE